MLAVLVASDEASSVPSAGAMFSPSDIPMSVSGDTGARLAFGLASGVFGARECESGGGWANIVPS